MRSYDLEVDVTGSTELEGVQHTAVTVHVPDGIDGPAPVVFGFPGAGYARGYYDIRRLPGYSQAEHHAAEGIVVVACDHLGVGHSSRPDPFELSLEAIAAGNHATTTAVLDRLRTGGVAEELERIEVAQVVGMGQSMGGAMLTVQQAEHRAFDAVAFLGWSGIHTVPPGFDAPHFAGPVRRTDLRVVLGEMGEITPPTAEQMRRAFHWDDADPTLVDPDMASYAPGSPVPRGDEATPWGTSGFPVCSITLTSPGVVTEEAAAIDVPILVAAGERDVMADPWAEPTAYRGSGDVSVFVVDRMAHMHNFAHTRELLWDRLVHFVRGVSAR